MSILQNSTFVPDKTPLEQAYKRCTHLGIGAHQDDLEIFAYHGIATCFEDPDLWFGGITVTDGGGSARSGPFAHYSDAEMRELRHREQNKAAEIGKYSFQVQLGIPSSMLAMGAKAEELTSHLESLIRSCRPRVVYLHNPVDKHPTHLALLKRCMDAIRRLPPENRPVQTYGCEVWRGLDWVDDDRKIALPVHQHPELARKLIDVFQSQVAGGKNYVDATLGRRIANATFFRSHAVDAVSSVTFALDLNPLIHDDTLSLPDFVDSLLEEFRDQALSALYHLED